jgi:hypothetical protein
MSTEKEAFAHHEAGHAVVAMLQGMQVRSISVERTNDSGGETDLQEIGMPIEELGQIVEDGRRPTACEIIILEQHVRMSLAGEIAQFHFAPKSVHDFHASFDMKFLEFLNRIAGSEREVNAWTELLRIQTELLINRHWKMIEAIATALLDRERLTGDEALEVLRTTPDHHGSIFPGNLSQGLEIERRFRVPR